MMELFHNAALKPRVHHWGTGATEMVWSIDINSCRRNALLMAPLPSFDFTDEPEPYDPKRFADYDLYWVGNGDELEFESCPCSSRRNCDNYVHRPSLHATARAALSRSWPLSPGRREALS